MQIYNSAKHINGTYTYDEQNNIISLKTNGYDCWDKGDRISFIYDRVDYLYDEKSSLTVEATVSKIDAINNFSSFGIMIRNDDVPGAANSTVLVRRQGILQTFRTVDDYTTDLVCIHRLDNMQLPIRVKLCLNGSIVKSYFMLQNEKEWKLLGSALVTFGKHLLIGVVGYVHEDFSEAYGEISNFKYNVVNNAPLAVNNKELIQEAQFDQDILYYEDFEKGTINLNKRKGYCWSNVTCANVVSTSGKDKTKTMAWFKNQMSGRHFIGNRKWADYSLSMDVKFCSGYLLSDKNQLALYVRHREMDFYGEFCYIVLFTKENEIQIRKKYASTTSPSSYGELLTSLSYNYLNNCDIWHNIKVNAFDNVITVFWDGKTILEYKDESGFICPVGNVGFGTEEAVVYIDNIIVKELEDKNGGAYDNLVGGLWNLPAPKNFTYSYDE